MSDLDLTKKTNFNQNQNTGSSQNLKDQVADAGEEVKQRAADALRASTDVAGDKFKEAADAAKDVASETAEKFQGEAHEQQRSGADFIQRFAGNIREASRPFESEAPFAARGINSAAEYVEDAAEKIRNGSFRDLVDGATDFAKRQPAAFLGISVLAGFAAFRFLKASGGQTSSSRGRNTERGDTSGGSPSAPRGEAWRQGSSRPDNSWEQTSSSQRGNVS